MFRDEVTRMNKTSDVHEDRAFAIRCYAWSRAIHWVTVALVITVLSIALFANIDPHGSGTKAFLWHSSLGIAVYLLTITRVLLWFVYRPRARNAVKPEVGVRKGLRAAFYALLIALPISGWWLASAEGVAVPVFWIPALPQWFYQEGATHLGSTASEKSREGAARESPAVKYLAPVHSSLGVALALVIALHLLSIIWTRK